MGSRWGRAIVVALLALALGGCGGGDDAGEDDPVNVVWDLSGERSPSVVGGRADDPERGVAVQPIETLRVVLPGDREVRIDGDMNRAGAMWDDEGVHSVVVVSRPLTADEALTVATRWADLVDVPTAPFERWEAGGAPEQGARSFEPGRRLGPDGPEPSIRVRTSFRDDEPFVVDLSLTWPFTAPE